MFRRRRPRQGKAIGQVQTGIFPVIKWPTGSAGRDVADIQAWRTFPVWTQKTWGPWIIHGGGGYVAKPAVSRPNFLLAGWIQQRDWNGKLMLRWGIHAQGADVTTDQGNKPVNLGGYHDSIVDFSLFFLAGHNTPGDEPSIAYLDLHRVWGCV